MPVRVELDADEAGRAAPSLERLEHVGVVRGVEEDPAQEALGMCGEHLGDGGVVGLRVDGVALAVQTDPGAGHGRAVHDLAERTRDAVPHERAHDGEQALGRVRERIVEGRDEDDAIDAGVVHLLDDAVEFEHARLEVRVAVDDLHGLTNCSQ